MATLAARDLISIVELTEQVAAIALLTTGQALDLSGAQLGARLAAHQTTLRRAVPRVESDRRMDIDQEAVLALLRSGAFDPERESIGCGFPGQETDRR